MTRPLLATLLIATAAGASSIRNEVGVSRTQTTDTSPRSGNVSDAFDATIDLNDHWSLLAGAMLTVEGQTAAAERGDFGTSASTIPLFTVGADFTPDDHFTIGATIDLSPQTTQRSGTDVTVTAGTTNPALLRTQSSEKEAALDVTYDTAGESELEWIFTAGVTATNFDSTQQIEKVRTATGVTLGDAGIKLYCTTHRCPRALLAALKATDASLDSQKLSLSALATIYTSTDVGVGVDYWHYSEDPAQIGYFSVATAGRQTITAGNGIPIAPLQWLVRPEIAHRFGDLQVRVWLQRGQYVDGMGQDTSGAGLKLQYKFNHEWKAWLKLAAQSDTDDQGQATKSGSVSMGAGYRF